MTMRQALLALPTWPDSVPERVLDKACLIAHLLGVSLTVMLPQLERDRSKWPAILGAFPLDIPRMMEQAIAASEQNAAIAAEGLDLASRDYHVRCDLRRNFTTLLDLPPELMGLARLHDLTMIPAPTPDSPSRSWAEAVLFGSGRPLVLLPAAGKPLKELNRIVVAWDYGREAARALADAMPLLAMADEVRFVTVLGEKVIQSAATGADLEKLLTAHGVRYRLHQVDLGEGSIGRFLARYCEGIEADMLVMGGYGHSRLREMVLGGATREVLADPKLPVLLSH